MKKGLSRVLLVMIAIAMIVSTIPAYEPHAEQGVPPTETTVESTPEKTEVVEEQVEKEPQDTQVTAVEDTEAPSVKVDGDWKDPYYETVRRGRSVAPEKPEKATIKTVSNGVGTGTGAMNLSWKAMPGATGYKVIIGNGYNYEYFTVGNVTSWTTKGKGIFPTKAELDKGLYRFHTDGKGTEFANDPTQLYENTFKAGTTWTLRGQKKYIVRVLATYTSGDGPTSDITEAVMPPETLPAKPEKSTIKTTSSGVGTGTGHMDITWQAVPGAIDYKVVIGNGYNYEYFNTGNVTSWSTKGKNIFPTQAEIANKQYKFHQDGKGVEFASDPRALYENGYQAGSTFGLRNQEKYIVRILAVYPWGDSPTSDITDVYMPLETPAPPNGRAYANLEGSNSGYVQLNWEQVANAEGYKVSIFDGKKNVLFDVGNTNSWTSQGKGIWPTEAEVAGGGWTIHTDGKGAELAQDPSQVYRNSGGIYGERKNYWFRVQAYTKTGKQAESKISDVYTPIIPQAGSQQGMVDYWTSIPVIGGAVNATNGNFLFSVTDFELEGRGPRINITRTFNSQNEEIGLFGKGWTSTVETGLREEPNGDVIMVEADNKIQRFTKKGISYEAPAGVYSTLVKHSDNYILIDQNMSETKYTSDGKVIYTQDPSGNRLTYDYNSDKKN
ncbi:DUF6531 domain-containing protein [Listeria cornellensis]|uniref:DUF6531 domain-containing protein n=1 Tax=Listeria cornellensis TaxID=1494961 RepID=UPI00055AC548|nr:DUF6531 domain-containing protein [Listeria cornellensis]